MTSGMGHRGVHVSAWDVVLVLGSCRGVGMHGEWAKPNVKAALIDVCFQTPLLA